MNILIIAILLIPVIALVLFIVLQKKKNAESTPIAHVEIEPEPELFPYKKKYLLTKNEWNFYKELKKVADKYNFTILAKVRIADIVDVENGLSKSDWAKYFGKIKSKHVDFVLCNPENLYIILLIELDDKSHEKEQRQKRDAFIEMLYEKTEYKLLRATNSADLEQLICNKLNLEKK